VVYIFNSKTCDGGAELKDILGNKGALLAEMMKLGVPVPPGFTIPASMCETYESCRIEGTDAVEDIWEDVEFAISETEKELGKKFGGEGDAEPLLFSVRSGAAVSMPGMLETVLNIGLNKSVCEKIAAANGGANKRFAYDAYRRLLDMFGSVVFEMDRSQFEMELERVKEKKGVEKDNELSAEDLMEVCDAYEQVYLKVDPNRPFPSDPTMQLKLAIEAVFESWNKPRAVAYREIAGLSSLGGTAVNVQSMVFGNLGETSGTGVCFTRRPDTGEKIIFGEYLINAQGEDVVAGIRTPEPISTLFEKMPVVAQSLQDTLDKLEMHFKNMQDIEFTIDSGKLFILQTRNGKRNGLAAINVAVDMYEEGLITKAEAIEMVELDHLNQLIHPAFKETEEEYEDAKISTGLAASPGAAVGRVAFSSEDVLAMKKANPKEGVILCRVETSAEDVSGMHASNGFLTQNGGMTSHAAVVARGWGLPCVSGVATMRVDEAKKEAYFYSSESISPANLIATVKSGDWISLNGGEGFVINRKVEMNAAGEGVYEQHPKMAKFMSWVEEAKSLGVYANADTAAELKLAMYFGAQGIGLCRTEHMLLASAERVSISRSMILAKDDASRVEILEKKMGPMLKDDFQALFEQAGNLPVTIRLLDPPLHEFLPTDLELKDEKFAADLAKKCSLESADALREMCEAKREKNPMMGLRGVRVGILEPKITIMQTKAIVNAIIDAYIATGVHPNGKIMVPLVSTTEEFENQRALIFQTIQEVFNARASEVSRADVLGPDNREIPIGMMCETPRACIVSGNLVEEGAAFMSFGSNDLSQLSFGFSRDDASSFLEKYKEFGIIETDPFNTIDVDGVGELIKMSVRGARAVNSKIPVSVCGEHGGDEKSIEFFHEAGLNVVSCSAFRVLGARLAAAKANIANPKSSTGAAGPR